MSKMILLSIAFLLPLVLAGCGGSSSSSSMAYTGTDKTAALSDPIAPTQSKGYTIIVAPSGAATYTITTVVGYSQGQLQYSTQTGSGTVPAALTTKFFQDLAAAVPVSKLPPFTGVRSVGSGDVYVTYQGQTGPIDDTVDAREAALFADNTAVAQALGVSIAPFGL